VTRDRVRLRAARLRGRGAVGLRLDAHAARNRRLDGLELRQAGVEFVRLGLRQVAVVLRVRLGLDGAARLREFGEAVAQLLERVGLGAVEEEGRTRHCGERGHADGVQFVPGRLHGWFLEAPKEKAR
jgi:hypothetical protein